MHALLSSYVNYSSSAGEDFIGGSVMGQFVALSLQLESCHSIPIIFDDVVEQVEIFIVDYSIDIDYPTSVRERLTVNAEPLSVIIDDSSEFRVQICNV